MISNLGNERHGVKGGYTSGLLRGTPKSGASMCCVIMTERCSALRGSVMLLMLLMMLSSDRRSLLVVSFVALWRMGKNEA